MTIPLIGQQMLAWDPQDDITTHELALMMPMFAGAVDALEYWRQLPDNAQRHWKIVTQTITCEPSLN